MRISLGVYVFFSVYYIFTVFVYTVYYIYSYLYKYTVFIYILIRIPTYMYPSHSMDDSMDGRFTSIAP